MRLWLSMCTATGEPTVMLLPSAPIVHSRQWKAKDRVPQPVPTGSSRSTRGARAIGPPGDPPRYGDESRFADDILAVMDATGVERAVLVMPQLDRCPASPPRRVRAPRSGSSVHSLHWAGAVPLWSRGAPQSGRSWPGVRRGSRQIDEGWARYNEHSWRRDYQGFLEFFFGQCFSRATLDQADRGLRRLGFRGDQRGGPRIRTNSAGIGGRPASASSRWEAGRVRCPVLRDPRRRRSDHPQASAGAENLPG